MKEIRGATFQLGKDKASGPDSFPLSFYKIFWKTVKDDIWRIFQELHEGNCFSGPFDYTYLCLIPKKDGVVKANDFRPISLLNGIQKIISKVLANILTPILHNLISHTQSIFLKGRNISDVFATACELLGWSNRSKNEGVGVKVDFEKASDKLNWAFLHRIMIWWGFGERWCGWIQQCVENAKVAVLVNGEPTKWFKSKRGV